jgi:hypothetical protein
MRFHFVSMLVLISCTTKNADWDSATKKDGTNSSTAADDDGGADSDDDGDESSPTDGSTVDGLEPDDDADESDDDADESDDDADESDDDADESDGDGDGDADDGSPTATGLVRFVALGDGGEGNEAQYAVAAAMKTLCDSKTDTDGPGCKFALYLGDNFYNEGVESVDDPQFETKFELPYADISFPFYVVLGNHDYGELSIDAFRVPHQVEYTDHSSKWYMPNEFYTKSHGHALFVGLDTNAIMVEDVLGDSGQDIWLSGIHSTNEATWTIAFGHHPYISNGRHGNAGAYEGFPFIPIVSGDSVKDFFDAQICGKVDLYISGHDHNRQWLNPTCGTEFIVSGAAAKNTDLEGRGTPTFWEDDTTTGFLWVELRDNTLTGEFYNRDGVLEYTHTVTK